MKVIKIIKTTLAIVIALGVLTAINTITTTYTIDATVVSVNSKTTTFLDATGDVWNVGAMDLTVGQDVVLTIEDSCDTPTRTDDTIKKVEIK